MTPHESAEIRRRLDILEDLLTQGKDTAGAMTQATGQCITELHARIIALEKEVAEMRDIVFAIKDELAPIDEYSTHPQSAWVVSEIRRIVKYAAEEAGLPVTALRSEAKDPATIEARHAAALVAGRRGHKLKVIDNALNKSGNIATYVRRLAKDGTLSPGAHAIAQRVEQRCIADGAVEELPMIGQHGTKR